MWLGAGGVASIIGLGAILYQVVTLRRDKKLWTSGRKVWATYVDLISTYVDIWTDVPGL